MVFNESLLDLSHVDNNCNWALTVSTIRFRDFLFKTTHVLLLLFATTRSVFKSVKVSVVEIAKRTN